MLRGANIVCLASIDWAFNWQLPQEVASAFANENRVLFVENTGVRAPRLRDAARLRQRLRNWMSPNGHAPRDVDVHAPLLVPLPYSRAAVALNTRVLLRTIRRWLRGRERAPLIVITFLPTPLALAIIRALRPDASVYYCADHFSESSPGARRLAMHEQRMFAEADLVLATSTGLLANASGIASRAALLPAGVRFADFQHARRRDGGVPDVFRDLDGPVVGFVGSMRNELDLALLGEVADLLPEMTFILAGPLVADVRALAARPNVRVVGALSHADVMRYMARFDAGIMPYILNSFTTHIMPVKLKEYLAAGLPVVATRLPDVLRFAEEHPGVVRFAADARAFADALRAAVADDDADVVARRMAIARRYDWSVQMEAMSDLIEEVLHNSPSKNSR